MRYRWMKYILSASLILSFTACVPLPDRSDAAAAENSSGFRDMPGHWAQETVAWAVAEQIVNGYEDGTFRPNQPVAEPEFLAMLLRAYPDGGIDAPAPGESWAAPYYWYAAGKNWPVMNSADPGAYNRGRVAQLIAASAGQEASIGTNDAIQFLLDRRYSNGKTAATVQGYAAADKLSRAEAVTFIRNLTLQKSYRPVAAVGTPPSSDAGSSASAGVGQTGAAIHVRGVAIGDTEAFLLQKLGQPARKDPSEYGFQWYIYNQSYGDYAQIGVSGGKVVGLYTTSANWTMDSGVADGSAKADVTGKYGNPLTEIEKGNTRFIQNYGKGEYGTYAIDDTYTTFFYDLFRNQVVTGVQVIAKPTEQAFAQFYPEASDALVRAFELETFDLANAGRVKLGLSAFTWDDRAAQTARSHSQDMADRSYFDHSNPDGQSPFDRMKKNGIVYRSAAENIAAGQTSAIFAHHGWMNSEGHRKNLLSDVKRLGVGVAFGGPMHIYYTQNFYTPQS